MNIRVFLADDRAAVIALWLECELVADADSARRDIDLKLAEQPGLFFVGELNGKIVGTIMVGYDGHRGWINYLAVQPTERRQRYGHALMSHAEMMLARKGCPKINLQIRGSNAQTRVFYEALGYVAEDRLSFGKRIDS